MSPARVRMPGGEARITVAGDGTAEVLGNLCHNSQENPGQYASVNRDRAEPHTIMTTLRECDPPRRSELPRGSLNGYIRSMTGATLPASMSPASASRSSGDEQQTLGLDGGHRRGNLTGTQVELTQVLGMVDRDVGVAGRDAT